jgi:hypothetical protein
MSKSKLAIWLVLAGAALGAAPASAARSASPQRPSASPQHPGSSPQRPSAPPQHTHRPALYQSPELWATVDVCNAPDQTHTIGLRGSMPGDGHPHDVMYMRFQVQFLNPTTKQWAFLTKDGDSGYLPIGSASTPRQSGRSFQLVPVAGQPTFTLRGVVSFQWRHAAKVVYSTSRTTTTGHKSLAGADPKGFSSATCALT